MTAEYKVHGDVAVITHEQPARSTAWATRPASASPRPGQGQRRPGRQGHRHHRRRQGVLGRRRHQGIRHAQGAARTQPAERDPRASRARPSRSSPRSTRCAWAAAWSWRWAATTASPRRAPARAARSQAGPAARRRRHAAPAARARRRDRAQHDRQRRAGQERDAGAAARPEAVRQAGRIGRVLLDEALAFAKSVAACRARCRWCATCHASTRRATPTSSSRATWSRAWRRTSRRRSSASTPSSRDQDEVRRRPGATSASIFTALMLTPESQGAAPPVLRRARRLQDPRRAGRHAEARHQVRSAVIGAGTMGGGIAMNFLNAGIPVTILEMKQEALDNGLATIRKNYEAQVKKGKLKQDKYEQRMALLIDHAELRRPRRRRPGDRGRVRGDGRQAEGVRAARRA